MPRIGALLFVAIVAAGFAMPAHAQGGWQDFNMAPPPPPPEPDAPVRTAAPAAPLPPIDDRVAFNHPERWLIPYYFGEVRERQDRAARSKNYERSLPASLKQKPAKGDVLTSAQRADLRHLPGPLVRQLPAERPDTERLIAGKDVLLVRSSTGEVLDVLGGVIF